MSEADVRDVCTPDLIGSDNRYATQQIGINLVLGVSEARVRVRCHADQAHRAHELLHTSALDVMPESD